MEEKKYEAGRVEISSAEYRDLIKEAVEAQRDASQARSDRWKTEDELRKCKEELALANKKIEELQSIISNLQAGLAYGSTPAPNNAPWWNQVTYTTLNNNKENN